jgi:hypothetical protein
MDKIDNNKSNDFGILSLPNEDLGGRNKRLSLPNEDLGRMNKRLSLPNEDLGRRNKRRNADFRSTFQWIVAQIEYSRP